MTISPDRFVQFIENRLASQDDSNFLNRTIVYNAARQALQKLNGGHVSHAVAGQPDSETLQRTQNLEFAIKAIEARYSGNVSNISDSPYVAETDRGLESHQPREPTPEILTELEPSIVWDDNLTFQNSAAPKQSFAGYFKENPAFSVLAIAIMIGVLALSVLAYPIGQKEASIPDLFPGIASEQKFQIAGSEFTLAFAAYGDLKVEQSTPSEIARLVLPPTDTPTDQISSFAFIPLEPAYAAVFADKNIRIGILARVVGDASSKAGLTARFHSSQLSLQGEFQELTKEYRAYYFDQEIPEETEETSAEMIIVAPANSPQGTEIEVKTVEVLVSETR